MSYLKSAVAVVATPPQSQSLNSRQVVNSAGGYSFPVDDWARLDRFLVLGAEGGSYYASERKLAVENIKAVATCVAEDGIKTVNRIVEISDSGRAPKNDPALLALAYAAAKGDLMTRQAALDALPKVARIGTHLYHFVDFSEQLRGWGRAFRTAVADWYKNMPADKLASQVTKYQQRDGWSHADLLRKSHASFNDPTHNAIARWVLGLDQKKRELVNTTTEQVRKYPAVKAKLPELIEGHIKIQAETNAKAAAKLIREYGLVRENIPTELLNSVEVWEALLEKMPMTAMIRNLGKMSNVGLLKPMSAQAKEVALRLTNPAELKKARIHPVAVLIAAKTYAAGHGQKGKLTWAAVPQIIDTLDNAYYNAFSFVESTGKRYYLGLDISGSMWSGNVCGIDGFPPAVAAGAMAMTAVKLEKDYYAAGFTCANRVGSSGVGGQWGGGNSAMTPVYLSPKLRLDSVVNTMQDLSKHMGGTDCALPMLDALEKKLDIDVFTVYTDSETWAGNIHPVAALEKYRQKTGIPAKLVVVGMVSNGFAIADPNDAGMLDCVGFDAATPQIIADFAR